MKTYSHILTKEELKKENERKKRKEKKELKDYMILSTYTESSVYLIKSTSEKEALKTIKFNSGCVFPISSVNNSIYSSSEIKRCIC